MTIDESFYENNDEESLAELETHNIEQKEYENKLRTIGYCEKLLEDASKTRLETICYASENDPIVRNFYYNKDIFTSLDIITRSLYMLYELKHKTLPVNIVVNAFERYLPSELYPTTAIKHMFHKLSLLDKYTVSINGTEENLTTCEIINRIWQDINKQIPAYQVYRKRQRDKQKRNKRRCQKLVNTLREIYSKLLVVRIDLSLPDNAKHDLNIIQQYFEKFLKALKNRNHTRKHKVPMEIVGYIWKLEYGEQKGFHYHLMFFFNGNRHLYDLKMGNMLRKIWQDVTDNKGKLFNCNIKKLHYKHQAVGLITHQDEKMFKNMDYVFNYFCKSEQDVSGLQLGKVRTFGTSSIPRIPLQRLGRPRSK